jgi:hypothetical protein
LRINLLAAPSRPEAVAAPSNKIALQAVFLVVRGFRPRLQHRLVCVGVKPTSLKAVRCNRTWIVYTPHQPGVYIGCANRVDTLTDMAYDDPPFFEGVRMAEKESLVIASKVKNYIKETAELKCSAAVIDVLSDKVRVLCDEAMKNAKADGRKTVQEKDFR